MSTITEPLSLPVTAQDKRALRNADSIVFRLYQGQATIEANRDGKHTRDGFDAKHTIYVGGAHVTDYSREQTYVPANEQHRYSGFHMEHSAQYSDTCRTLVERLRIGGTASLRWIRNNSSPLTQEAGLVMDELFLVVNHPARETGKSPRPDVYLVDTLVSRDNSARMVKVTS